MTFDLPVVSDTWPPFSTERLWVARTDVHFDVSVRNTPFYVLGVAFGDTIRVIADPERRELVFESILSKSGSSTVRLIVEKFSSAERISDILIALQCSWEVDPSGILWAVNVPAEVNYRDVRRALDPLIRERLVQLEEGALAETHRTHIADYST